MTAESPCEQLLIDNTKDKYPNNHWWNFENSEMAKYQVFEPVLLVEFSDFQDGLEILFNRKLASIEFTKPKMLQKEVLEIMNKKN